MTMVNGNGEKIYYNTVKKHGKWCYIVQAASGQAIIGWDRQKRKTRTFTQEQQVESWLRRNGYKAI